MNVGKPRTAWGAFTLYNAFNPPPPPPPPPPPNMSFENGGHFVSASIYYSHILSWCWWNFLTSANQIAQIGSSDRDVTLTIKSKKIHFFKGCGEKMTITPLTIKLAPWNYFHSIENFFLVKIKPKRDTRLQKKKRAELDFCATVVKIPSFFQFFCLNGFNF